MGKVVPFARNAGGENLEQAHDSSAPHRTGHPFTEVCCEQRAERLIGEAARLLTETAACDASVPWILEDCIELLRARKGASSATVESAPEPSGNNCSQPDPRLKLNTNLEVTAIVRK